MPSQKNIEQVEEIKGRIDGCTAMWLVDYRGLNVKQVQELRKLLRGVDADMKVYKNTLTNIALKDLGKPEMDEYLAGPNGFVFASGEDIAPSAKILKDFSKKNKALEIRGGLVDENVFTAEQVIAIADLPSREELIAKLLGTLNNPMTKIVRVLNEPMACLARSINAIAEKKPAA